jgi:hypothetical protein
MTANKMIRIRFADDETGWAERLEGNRARIANVPYVHGLNIDDVVELHPGSPGDLPIAGDVLINEFPCKTALDYPAPHNENFKRIAAALHAKGCKVEGVVAGLCIVAHKNDVHPLRAAREAGVDASLFEARP